MWYAVYEKATGRLVSTGTVLGSLPEGLAYKEYADNQLELDYMWDEAMMDFVPKPDPSEPVVDQNLVDAEVLISKETWTSTEINKALTLLLKRAYEVS